MSEWRSDDRNSPQSSGIPHGNFTPTDTMNCLHTHWTPYNPSNSSFSHDWTIVNGVKPIKPSKKKSKLWYQNLLNHYIVDPSITKKNIMDFVLKWRRWSWCWCASILKVTMTKDKQQSVVVCTHLLTSISLAVSSSTAYPPFHAIHKER